MLFHPLRQFLLFLFALVLAQTVSAATSSLEDDFARPPTVARPYVWWHWMGPTFSKEGITKDLEAMKAAGIGGATIFNLSSGVRESNAAIPNAPWPQNTYRSPAYWEALVHAAAEAQRLGLEIGLHNTVGYSTTGGPWITQERNMQRIVYSETIVEGGRPRSLTLPRPILSPNVRYGTTHREPLTYYRDIAVLAVPSDGPLALSSIVDLTDHYSEEQGLAWHAPAGSWRIYRIGHGPTGAMPAPVPDDVIGLAFEADKMSAAQTKFHWEHVLTPLQQQLGPYLGKSFGHVLIDSYEAGDQDWTPAFREEFKRAKGYDPVPWLLSRMRGFKDNAGKPSRRVINSTEETERFDHDYKELVARLYRTQGWELGAEMIHRAGLTLQFEAYGGPFDTVAGSALADLPMGEFWNTSQGFMSGSIVGAARAAGKRIIGAEAFTGKPDTSQWTETPAQLKRSADGFFSTGGNRLILHHWVHQPFDDRFKPGMGMGWWGTHFSRHQTWFEPGKAFLSYLARTQALLQRGEATIPVLSVGTVVEGSDVIPEHVLLKGVRVERGQIVLESGRKYPLLVVPVGPNKALSLPVLRRLAGLLQEGAAVVASRPVRTPGLEDYPACDGALRELADTLWGTGAASTRRVGEGTLYGNGDLKQAMSDLGLKPLWTLGGSGLTDVRVTQRHDTQAGAELFFVANLKPKASTFTLTCSVSGLLPELWDPEDGSRRTAPNWRMREGVTEVDLSLEGEGSIFVVFRTPTQLTEAMEKQRPAPSVQVVGGPWELTFAPGMGTPDKVQLTELRSWSEHPEPSIRYFSGSANYRCRIAVTADSLAAGKRLQLDLGDVRDLATVRLNGRLLRVLWHAPYRVDLSQAAQVGENVVDIEVCNTWHNRLIGDEQEPEDVQWSEAKKLSSKLAGRSLEAYPEWFLKNQPRPSAGRKAFVIWNYFTKDSPLIPAGLLGPVRLLSD